MSEDSTEIMRRWWEGFNQQGMPPLDLCDEQIVIDNPPAFLVRGPYHGHKGVREWVDAVFEVIEEPSVEIEELIEIDDGETAFMGLRVLGRFRHTQMEAEMSWAAVVSVRNGKLIRAQGYMSRAEAREAAGLSPG